ncbi:MAG: hypothetical protein ABW205_06965 [Burkholderiales bacterium]
MNLRDFTALRTPLLVLLSVVAVGAVSIEYSTGLVKRAESELKAQKATLQEARTRYQRSGDEKDTIVRYLGSYEKLQREGVVGEEQRINWIDGLRLANIQSELFGVDYQIGVQQPYGGVGEFDAGGIKLRQSVMKIRIPLLHEGDLLRFLARLEKQRVGLFTVNKCSLERTGTASASPRYQPNLSAECDLAWITLIEDSGKDKKA